MADINPAPGKTLTIYELIEDVFIVHTAATVFEPAPFQMPVTSTITVSHSNATDKGTVFGMAGVVSQTIAFKIDTVKNIEDDLNLQHYLTGFLIKAGTDSPHGQSSYLSPAAEAAKEALTPHANVTFSFYGTGDPVVVTLRPPIWGNKNNYQAVRIQRETKGKDLQVFQDNMWPTTEILTLEFTYLTQETADAFMDFINTYNGRMIYYVDHMSTTWSGFIINPDAEFRQVGRNNISVSIQFQGVMQS